MAALEDDFESWLSFKLKELNTDENVFGSYIKGILDGEETLEEKTEALEGILTEITVSPFLRLCYQINIKLANLMENIQFSCQFGTLIRHT